MPAVTTEEHLKAARAMTASISVYSEIEDMIRLGAYKKGHDLRSDRSVELRPLIESFLKQTPEEKSDFHVTVSALEALVAEDSSESTL
jgi:flagellum-specific ATP synthase